MFSRQLLTGMFCGLLLSNAFADGNHKVLEKKEQMAEQIMVVQNKDSNVVLRKTKAGIPIHTVYSENKVEYADVATIEKLKKAVVILINKVENFEKKLSLNEVSANDLKNLQSSIKKDLNNRLIDTIRQLKSDIKQNKNNISKIKVKYEHLNKVYKNNYHSTKNIHKKSEYDKKIEAFLQREKSNK